MSEFEDIRARVEAYEDAQETYNQAVKYNPGYSTQARRDAVKAMDCALENMHDNNLTDIRRLLNRVDALESALGEILAYPRQDHHWDGEMVTAAGHIKQIAQRALRGEP